MWEMLQPVGTGLAVWSARDLSKIVPVQTENYLSSELRTVRFRVENCLPCRNRELTSSDNFRSRTASSLTRRVFVFDAIKDRRPSKYIKVHKPSTRTREPHSPPSSLCNIVSSKEPFLLFRINAERAQWHRTDG